MIRVGIECEQIEGEKWGVGTSVFRLLEAISQKPELAKTHEFHLYFKSKIPNVGFLNNPIFHKKIIRLPILSNLLDYVAPASFSIYYYVLVPIKLWFEKMDVVFFPNNMLPILFRGKSIVVVNPDLHYETYHGTLPFRYKLAYRIFGNWAVHHGTKIMTFSESARREVIDLYKVSPERIVANYHGLDIEREKIDSKIPTDEYIMYLGQAFPRRRLREIMLAFEKIAPDFPNLKLMAFGYDKYNPKIIRGLVIDINKRLNREAIVHSDYADQDRKTALFSGAKAFMYISSSEAFGIPPLEALACGTIPLVADTPMTREILGDCAYFIQEPDSIDAIANTLRQALTNQEKTGAMTEKGMKLTEKYTWSAHADRFLEIIEKIIHA